VSYDKSEQVQQANVFNRVIFQRIVQIKLKIYPATRRSDCMRELTAAMVASVVETTRRPASSSSTRPL